MKNKGEYVEDDSKFKLHITKLATYPHRYWKTIDIQIIIDAQDTEILEGVEHWYAWENIYSSHHSYPIVGRDKLGNYQVLASLIGDSIADEITEEVTIQFGGIWQSMPYYFCRDKCVIKTFDGLYTYEEYHLYRSRHLQKIQRKRDNI